MKNSSRMLLAAIAHWVPTLGNWDQISGQWTHAQKRVVYSQMCTVYGFVYGRRDRIGLPVGWLFQHDSHPVTPKDLITSAGPIATSTCISTSTSTSTPQTGGVEVAARNNPRPAHTQRGSVVVLHRPTVVFFKARPIICSDIHGVMQWNGNGRGFTVDTVETDVVNELII